MNAVVKINFHGNELTVIEKDGVEYVAMKSIVEALGINRSNQCSSIITYPVLWYLRLYLPLTEKATKRCVYRWNTLTGAI